MLEAGVGTAASAHVFATFPKLAWGTELFGPLLLTEEILTEPLDYAEFSLAVPTGPGLGGGGGIICRHQRANFAASTACRAVNCGQPRMSG